MPIIIDIHDAGPPKRQIIELAFSECAMAGYEFGRTPEEVTDALTRLNAMMAEWKTFKGIDLGYDQPHYGTGNPDGLSGIPHETLNVVASYLALRIAPMMGAALSGEAKGNLARSLALLEAHYALIPTMPLATNSLRGAGRGTGLYFGPFIRETADDVNPLPEDI
jgi:P22 tail accessory factor